MEDLLGPRSLPNLQELREPNVGFLADGARFLSVRPVTLAYMNEQPRGLFAHCPHLVQLDVLDSPMGTPPPNPPFPPTLEEVSIRCERPRALDLVSHMRHWRGVRVPRLVVHEVYSLRDVLPLFLASHSQAIEMRLPDGADDVVLAAIPDDESVWTLSPSPPWAADFLASIEKPTSHRLTSISVAFSRLGELLRAQLHTPGLEQLEIRLDNTGNANSPFEGGDAFFLRAPRLRSVSFNLANESTVSLETNLAVLRTSFRSLFVYDTELLEVINVSRHAESICASFATLAKEYTVLSGRC